jgi:hypothetical protein
MVGPRTLKAVLCRFESYLLSHTIQESSNGRTTGSELVYPGSNPGS